MAVNQKRAAKLVSQGLPNHLIAKILECDESYISQLRSDPDFCATVSKLGSKQLEDNELASTRIANMRNRAIGKLEESIDFITKPLELVAVIEKLDSIMERETVREALAKGGIHGPANVNNVVQLTLPQGHNFSFTLSTNREVIEVDGRTLQTMSSRTILDAIGEGTSNDGAKTISGASAKQLPPPASDAEIQFALAEKQVAALRENSASGDGSGSLQH